MEFKGSHGPWEVRDNGEYFEVHVQFSILDCVASTVETQSCRDNGHHSYDGLALANAHLIAAAPELLEALQSLVTVSGLLLGNTCQTELTKARLAIAKAIGKQ